MRIPSTSKETALLRQAIEQKVGHPLCAPSDFERLSAAIYTELHENISPFTLRRIWGYTLSYRTNNRHTLHVLARYAGYGSWEQFCSEQNEQSDFVQDNNVWASQLAIGSRVCLTWNPDRTCLLRHEGGGVFCVEQVENAKLHAGDRLRCERFCVGEPLYARVLSADLQHSATYMAGKREGICSLAVMPAEAD